MSSGVSCDVLLNYIFLINNDAQVPAGLDQGAQLFKALAHIDRLIVQQNRLTARGRQPVTPLQDRQRLPQQIAVKAALDIMDGQAPKKFEVREEKSFER